MECLHTSCCHNSKCLCGCSSVKMSAGGGGAKCSSYQPDASFRNRLKGDVEIAKDFDNNISCSAENCVFNIHFACNAGRVKVSNGGRCTTYNRV